MQAEQFSTTEEPIEEPLILKATEKEKVQFNFVN